jgi:hypothetical protein
MRQSRCSGHSRVYGRKGGEDASGQPAKECQTSLPERRNSPRMAQIVDEIVLDYKIDPGANNRSNENPGQQALDLGFRKPPLWSPLPNKKSAEDEGD